MNCIWLRTAHTLLYRFRWSEIPLPAKLNGVFDNRKVKFGHLVFISPLAISRVSIRNLYA